MDVEEKQREVDNNYEAFIKILPRIVEQHSGQYALMKDREIVSYHKTFLKAREKATKHYPDGLFSIQEISAEPVDLGYFSRA